MITSAPATAEMTAAAETLLGTPRATDSVRLLGERVTIVLSQRQTGGSLTVMDVRSPVGGGMPFLHAHPGAKTFVGMEGTYDVYGVTEGEKVTLTICPGTTVHVPSGAPHGYANVSDTTGRLLVLIHGANRMEAFVRASGTPIADPSQPVETPHTLEFARLRVAMEEYGIRLVEEDSD